MKNTFAVSMTVLLALTLGGSILGYRLATAEEKPAAEAAQSTEPSPKDVTPATPGPSAESGAAANGDASAPSSAGATQATTNAANTASSTQAAGAAAGNTTTAAANTTAAAAATTNAGDAAKGKALFASASCAGCHGANGEGGIGPNLHTADGPKSWTLDQFNTALKTGNSPHGMLKAPMMQFPNLSDADVANVYAYIKTLN
ncbi:c-type cytochrome [Deinococcus ruber]|uniref:C-type cytochrome n=1 Tax=Deinococcus ruber TaxID=1848197 RepID=A0A918C0A5_9DEIO|nr:cytochrome c [Deinococcus ruber]GGQ97858.1 c-type cytochrome [Deinococcus ruber]